MDTAPATQNMEQKLEHVVDTDTVSSLVSSSLETFKLISHIIIFITTFML